jgi:hypothetical protein
VSNGNITIKLGKPKNEYLDYIISYIGNGITVSDNSAMAFLMEDDLTTQDEDYELWCENADASKWVSLIYVTKDVTITGTYSGHDVTENYNASLKAGWNYLIWTESGTNTYTITAALPLPEDVYWIIYED